MSNRSHKRSARHFPGLTWPQKTAAQRSEWRLLIGEPKVRKKRRDLGGGGERCEAFIGVSVIVLVFFKIGGNKMRSRAAIRNKRVKMRIIGVCYLFCFFGEVLKSTMTAFFLNKKERVRKGKLAC